MNSIEKITSRITEEAESYASDVVKKARERAEGIISEANKKAEQIKSSYAEKAAKESDAIILRAASSADILERNILLDAKSIIIDEVFKKAEKDFTEIDKESYFNFLVRTLKAAIEFLAFSEDTEEDENEQEESDIYILTLNSDDKASLGKKLLASVKDDVNEQKKAMELSDTPGDFSGGLKLRLGNIEVSATLDALLKTAKEKTEAEVYSILFR